MDEVYRGLFISGSIIDYSDLNSYNIKSVINVKSEEHDTISILTEMAISYYYIPIVDWGQPRKGQIETLLKVWKKEKKNGNVLIHCAVGRGRSACMALAIMVHEGMSFGDAIKQILERRPCVTMLSNQIDKIRRELD